VFSSWEDDKTNIFKKAQDRKKVLVKNEEQFESPDSEKIIKFNAMRARQIMPNPDNPY
jgi:hypothetical protein